ncbi:MULTISPECIES: sensor domain-containing protein [Streptomyces]|uniref:Putative sensor domain-containing protein n=1 Tax=Streptomyces lycii TaxID=2654337 RepID=A0ABQ7FHR2_9ACTN|nr:MULTISPECIES: sensor domain-containing protein [Streptomyces]KAF4406792.1 hypothetical protein GCU69_23390 [Streptomyces lycii]PGH49866.1 hypothetical protein CRI70_15275 [Streptomyces sp. Ru87]
MTGTPPASTPAARTRGGGLRQASAPRPVAASLRLLRGAAPWKATAYLAGHVLLGPPMFALCTVTLVVTFALNITMLGLPLLLVAAAVLRGCAHIERMRVRLVAEPVQAAYRTVEPTGLLAAVKARWSDPATLRDVACLVVLFVPLLLLDALALALWVTTLALILVPTWYWAVPDGSAIVVLRVDTLPAACLAALAACLLALVTVHAVVGAAKLHSTVVRYVLGPRADPLAEAKRLLAEPGPLARPGLSESTTSHPGG